MDQRSVAAAPVRLCARQPAASRVVAGISPRCRDYDCATLTAHIVRIPSGWGSSRSVGLGCRMKLCPLAESHPLAAHGDLGVSRTAASELKDRGVRSRACEDFFYLFSRAAAPPPGRAGTGDARRTRHLRAKSESGPAGSGKPPSSAHARPTQRAPAAPFRPTSERRQRN